jgi:hypothetical protein
MHSKKPENHTYSRSALRESGMYADSMSSMQGAYRTLGTAVLRYGHLNMTFTHERRRFRAQSNFTITKCCWRSSSRAVVC